MTIVEEIISNASRLTDRERAAIAAAMIETLPHNPVYDVADEEVEQRRQELDSGEDVEISFNQLRAGLDL